MAILERFCPLVEHDATSQPADGARLSFAIGTPVMSNYAGTSTLAILASVGFFTLFASCVFGLGLTTMRLGTRDRCPMLLVLVIEALSVGFVEFSLILLLMGHLGMLRRWPIAVVLAALSLLLLGNSNQVGRIIRSSIAGYRRAWKSDRILTLGCTLITVLVIVATVRPPTASDEVAYHWRIPIFWATHHGWAQAPFRFSTGPNLMEVNYTIAAVFQLPMVAHLMHAMTLGIAVAAVAQLSVWFSGKPLIAVACMLAVPAAVFEAPLAFNDVAYTAFLLGGAVALAWALGNKSNLAIVGVCIAGAIATKPISVLDLPAVAIVGWFAASRALRRQSSSATIRPRTSALAGLGAALAAIGAAFAVHLYLMTGSFLPRADEMVISRTTQVPTGRIPNVVEAILTPLQPLYTAVLGNREPFGNRTGLVLLVLGPVGAVLLLARTPRPRRRLVSGLIAASGIHLLLVTLIFPRTRFNLILYAYLLIALSVILADGVQIKAWMAVLLQRVLWVAVALSMADIAHILLRPP